MKDQLISEISKQLNIAETAGTESLCKAIYSATGKMALASIWDHPEDEKFVSIQHFKKRAARVWTHIFPFTQRLYISSHRIGAVSLRIYMKPTEGTDSFTILLIGCILRHQVPEGRDNAPCTGAFHRRSRVT